MYVRERIDVCVDCLFLIANGSVITSAGDDVTDEHAAKMAAVWGESLRHMVAACNSEDCGWFSWTACEGCGCTLGGDRHRAAVLAPEPSDDR